MKTEDLNKYHRYMDEYTRQRNEGLTELEWMDWIAKTHYFQFLMEEYERKKAEGATETLDEYLGIFGQAIGGEKDELGGGVGFGGKDSQLGRTTEEFGVLSLDEFFETMDLAAKLLGLDDDDLGDLSDLGERS